MKGESIGITPLLFLFRIPKTLVGSLVIPIGNPFLDPEEFPSFQLFALCFGAFNVCLQLRPLMDSRAYELLMTIHMSIPLGITKKVH